MAVALSQESWSGCFGTLTRQQVINSQAAVIYITPNVLYRFVPREGSRIAFVDSLPYFRDGPCQKRSRERQF